MTNLTRAFSELGMSKEVGYVVNHAFSCSIYIAAIFYVIGVKIVWQLIKKLMPHHRETQTGVDEDSIRDSLRYRSPLALRSNRTAHA